VKWTNKRISTKPYKNISNGRATNCLDFDSHGVNGQGTGDIFKSCMFITWPSCKRGSFWTNKGISAKPYTNILYSQASHKLIKFEGQGQDSQASHKLIKFEGQGQDILFQNEFLEFICMCCWWYYKTATLGNMSAEVQRSIAIMWFAIEMSFILIRKYGPYENGKCWPFVLGHLECDLRGKLITSRIVGKRRLL